MSNDPILIGMLEMTYNYKSDFKVWWQGGPAPTLRAENHDVKVLTEVSENEVGK